MNTKSLVSHLVAERAGRGGNRAVSAESREKGNTMRKETLKVVITLDGEAIQTQSVVDMPEKFDEVQKLDGGEEQAMKDLIAGRTSRLRTAIRTQCIAEQNPEKAPKRATAKFVALKHDPAEAAQPTSRSRRRQAEAVA